MMDTEHKIIINKPILETADPLQCKCRQIPRPNPYKSRRYHLHQGQGVPSKVEGRGRSLRPSLYFSMGNAQNVLFYVLVSKYLQSVYFMLSILIKTCLELLSHLSQPHKFTFWSQKWQKTLILTIFQNFRYFGHGIAYDVTVTSYMGCWYFNLVSLFRRDL